MFPTSILHGSLSSSSGDGETPAPTYNWGTKRLLVRGDRGLSADAYATSLSSGSTVVFSQSWSESPGSGTTPLRTSTMNKIWLDGDEYEVSSVQRSSHGLLQINLATPMTETYGGSPGSPVVHVELTGLMQFAHNSITASQNQLLTINTSMGSLATDSSDDASYSFEQFIGETFTLSAYPNETRTITDVGAQTLSTGQRRSVITFTPAFSALQAAPAGGTVTIN